MMDYRNPREYRRLGEETGNSSLFEPLRSMYFLVIIFKKPRSPIKVVDSCEEAVQTLNELKRKKQRGYYLEVDDELLHYWYEADDPEKHDFHDNTRILTSNQDLVIY